MQASPFVFIIDDISTSKDTHSGEEEINTINSRVAGPGAARCTPTTAQPARRRVRQQRYGRARRRALLRHMLRPAAACATASPAASATVSTTTGAPVSTV